MTKHWLDIHGMPIGNAAAWSKKNSNDFFWFAVSKVS